MSRAIIIIMLAGMMVLHCASGIAQGVGKEEMITRPDKGTEIAVMQVLDDYSQAFEARDADAVLALYASDPSPVVIGTGEDEKRIGKKELKAQIERDFAQTGTMVWEWGWHRVSMAGPVALVAADFVARAIIDKEDKVYPGRLTAALEKQGDKWLIVQWHASMPAGGQAPGESFPRKGKGRY